MKIPNMAVSDEKGNIFEVPGIRMIGMSWDQYVNPAPADIIEVPYGSNLFMMPGRVALGFDPRKDRIVEVREIEGERVWAASVFMAPAYLQILRTAYVKVGEPERLPLYSYTALGFRGGKFYAVGMRIDPDKRQDPALVDLDAVARAAKSMKKRYRGNRLVEHLVDNCVFCYGCPAARNFVLMRFECPLPTSIACNSKCVGCLSKQPESSKVSQSQNRIAFIPEPEDIAEFAIPHLENADRAVVSFGQGCEGEPLLAGDVLEASIREIRKKTSRGIINLNTNGSKPDVVKRLLDAGLDSIRVSINSCQEKYYSRYFGPSAYGFEQAVQSLSLVREYSRWSSINYFMFPGFTDRPEEVMALENIIAQTRINMIQTRNINIDPQWYMESIEPDTSEFSPQGMREWVSMIRDKFPWIKLGYFNPPREEMKKEHFDFS
jgi:wyosine [tRNA(Phe)-imidazoG37] synthetase (radical SAM superfamily)